MEWKNALTVCLISLFSATLVVLIARSLDSQAAARLEPQLAQIVKELRALRGAGGGAAAEAGTVREEAAADGLVVYYFHGKTRCPTCQAIESQTHAVLQSRYAAEVERGEVNWKTLNYESPANAELVKKFDVLTSVVVLARMKGGKLGAWKRLDRVWDLWDDPPAFSKFVQDEIAQILGAKEEPGARGE